MLKIHLKIFIICFIFYRQTDLIDIKQDISNVFNEISKITGVAKGGEEKENQNSDGGNSVFVNAVQRFAEKMKEQENFEEATRYISKKNNLTAQEILELRNINLSTINPTITQKCLKSLSDIKCNRKYPYRTYDGSCNNLMHKDWGKSYTCFNRMLYPAYSDGISAPRKSVYGDALPDPRTISINIHTDKDVLSKHNFTPMLPHFGQFVAHDMAYSFNPALTTFEPFVDCCENNASNHKQCSPIFVSKDDPFYSKYKVTCLNNARTNMCVTCSLGPREQTNSITSFIDGSEIYGSFKEQAYKLRNFDGKGTLKFITGDGGELPPKSSIPDKDLCSFQNKEKKCFEGGDVRFNQQIMLIGLHVFFLRHHNNIARKLHLLHDGTWDEEKIFQITRKIVVAQLQMIIYNELLPKIIGEEAMDSKDLFVKSDLSYTDYNPTANPTIYNEFSSAAYRFGHTLVSNIVPEIFHHSTRKEKLQDVYFWPFNFYDKDYLEALIKGMSSCPAQEFDRFIAEGLTNHLYKFRGEKWGMDLKSLDIFRERDHGIPAYVDVVRHCSGHVITSFDQLKPLLQEDSVENYQRVYRHVADIDLLSVAYQEIPNENAIVGPTLACIISKQFHQLKFGDRFYFEHKNQVGSFTPDELREIKKISLAKIICSTTDINNIQRDVLIAPNSSNPMLPCSYFPEIDLKVFK